MPARRELETPLPAEVHTPIGQPTDTANCRVRSSWDDLILIFYGDGVAE